MSIGEFEMWCAIWQENYPQMFDKWLDNMWEVIHEGTMNR